MEYTKGDWIVDQRVGCIAVYTQEQYDKANCKPCIGDAGKYAIHFKDGFQGKEGWELKPEDIANAHLIAKAPRMYEACKVSRECLMKRKDITDQEFDLLGDLDRVIAKVEGGKQ